MNQLEAELLKRRILRPVENWYKIVEAAKSRAFSEIRRSQVLTRKLVVSLYDEVWEQPEKIVFFRDNVVDLGILFPYLKYLVSSYYTAARIQDQLKVNYTNAIVTADSVLSYIAIKDYGFRINRSYRGERCAAVILLVSKTLHPSILFPILSNRRLGRIGKLIKLNSILGTVALPDLLGSKEDYKSLREAARSVNCAEKLAELLVKVGRKGNEPTRNRAVKATGT